MNEKKCSICCTEQENRQRYTDHKFKIVCFRCGEVILTETDYIALPSRIEKAEKINKGKVTF